MKVELSIKDDKELRDLIRDMIRGQITGIARKEVTKMVQADIQRMLKSKPKDWLEEMFQQCLYRVILNWSREQYFGSSGQAMTPIIKSAIKNIAKEFIIPRLEKQFTEKLTDKFIKKNVEEIVRNKILGSLNLVPTGEYHVLKVKK